MRILVVEDEEKLARYLKKGLEESSYVVDLALNGTDGLHLATHESYDLIILDIMLPKINGYEICRTVRKHDGAR